MYNTFPTTPSKNRLARNMQILQVFFLQVLQEKYLQDLHISCKTVFTGHTRLQNNSVIFL